MQFDSKIRRARRAQRKALGLDEKDIPQSAQEEPVELEKGDLSAMLISAFFTLFLPAAAVLCGFALLILLLVNLL
jgi:hypothetical protein